MSSTTPTPPPPPPAVSLTERRKAETRMEIARVAAGLFVRQGLRATRAEDIAQAAGVAPRTFYRYFASKEEAIGPLYADGARRWVEAVRAAPAGTPLPRVLEDAARHTLTPGRLVSEASFGWARTLIRLAEADPALRRVWAEACRAAERQLAEVLAERLTAAQVPTGADNVAARSRLDFTAAVASAAVRTAMESWASGDGPSEGPQGPADLAIANLAALRDFPWEPSA
ncbi:TetR/AcrR family transcriptional regulator [Streptomyces griseoflavus]|uniref:TetR-family transcriptional regulator n=1 Tax=Streptomyces griseoflavus Tu4000 TaxID=467200 RepID=D9XUM1_9ACTN|nr:TetR family transcriptional regulator [Streptomyces griseoflavus]EFL40858.1 TetR-family transcriptional regulator [Streptomyces griseoflavus Tu4000]